MEGVHVRPAREADLEELAEVHACAYPEPGGYEHHARCLTHNAFGGLDCIRVAEKDGRIVGHAALYRLELWLGGRAVPTAGIGSLAVAPEARRQHVARALLGDLHREIASVGCGLSLLYPFQQRFYMRHGYAAVSPMLTLEVATDAFEGLPHSDGKQLSAVRLEGARVFEARQLYEEVARRTAGRISRSEARWLALFAREHRHWVGVAPEGGKLEGYAAFSYEGRPMSRDQKLVVHELTARSRAGTHALLSVLGLQRDQVADIELTLPYEDPLVFVFEDAAGRRRDESASHPIGRILAGPMVRIVDLPRALSQRGYAADGELTFQCTDDPTSGSPEALVSVRLVVREGVGQALQGGGRTDVEVSRATLASIVAAGIRPIEAEELGLLRGSSAAIDVAQQMFSGPRFQCLDPF